MAMLCPFEDVEEVEEEEVLLITDDVVEERARPLTGRGRGNAGRAGTIEAVDNGRGRGRVESRAIGVEGRLSGSSMDDPRVIGNSSKQDSIEKGSSSDMADIGLIDLPVATCEGSLLQVLLMPPLL
jgi:hypothetical protein